MTNPISSNQTAMANQQRFFPGLNPFQPGNSAPGFNQLPSTPAFPGFGQQPGSMFPSLPNMGGGDQVSPQNIMPWINQLFTQLQEIISTISSIFGGQITIGLPNTAEPTVSAAPTTSMTPSSEVQDAAA